MVLPKPLKKVVVTHNSIDHDLSSVCSSVQIDMEENAAAVATLIFADKNCDLFENKLDVDDVVRIYLNYAEVENPLTAASLRFYGFLGTPTYSLSPYLTAIQAKSYAQCFLNLPNAEQYGSQSKNPTLDTIKKILIDNTKGIIPLWINKLLGVGADASGYSLDYSLIEDIAGQIKYIYNPYKPVQNCLEDLLNLIQATKAYNPPAAGCHWIVKTEESGGIFTHYFMLATVGNHPSSPNIAAKWSTWWNTDRTNSTLIEGVDFSSLKLSRQKYEANLVVYAGQFQRPANGDSPWTEYGGETPPVSGEVLWGHTTNSKEELYDDNVVVKVGSYSLKFNDNGGGLGYPCQMWYPSNQNLALNVTKIGGIYRPATINFYCRYDATTTYSAYVKIRLWTSTGNYFEYNLKPDLTLLEWNAFSLPIGTYIPEDFPDFGGWDEIGSPGPNWNNINAIEFYMTIGVGESISLWVDGLCLRGAVIRVAKKANSPPYEIKTTTDEVAKDDSISVDDDTGLIASLAKAELIRAARTPLIGYITIPGKPSILPGQLCHIHGGFVSGSTYRTNQDMRILNVEHILQGGQFLSSLTVTDDLYNSQAMKPAWESYNLLQQQVAPEYQTRQWSSIKAQTIDITLPRFEKTYTFDRKYPVTP